VLAATIVASASQAPAPPTAPPASAAPAPQAGPAATAPQPGSAAPADDKNAATFTRVCSTCHDAQRILSNRRTKDQWGEVLDKMVERGAQGTDEDFEQVMSYLMAHYGRINVNRGTVQDLETVLKLPEKDAAAIVEYRKTNGPFTDFEALTKVPGINADALSQNRDAVSF
jgi:competence protein ComEA